MALNPLKDSILFTFIDNIVGGQFVTHTRSGILLTNKNTDDTANNPRWGKVLAIGNTVQDVKVGDFVLIAPLRWTLGFKYDGVDIWKTVEGEVLGVAENIEEVSQLYL